jgi:hypothetical protein
MIPFTHFKGIEFESFKTIFNRVKFDTVILLNGRFCALGLASVRRKHCVSTKTRFSNLTFVGNSTEKNKMLVETQCLRLTDAKNAQNHSLRSIKTIPLEKESQISLTADTTMSGSNPKILPLLRLFLCENPWLGVSFAPPFPPKSWCRHWAGCRLFSFQ